MSERKQFSDGRALMLSAQIFLGNSQHSIG